MTLTTITETFREDEIETDLYGPYFLEEFQTVQETKVEFYNCFAVLFGERAANNLLSLNDIHLVDYVVKAKNTFVAYYEVDTLPDNVFEVKVVEAILESITAHTIQNTN